MSALTYKADSSGIGRRIKKIYMADAGGTVRLIKKRYRADANGIARFVFGAGIYSGTMIAGVSGNYIGYQDGGFGSLSPPTDDGGATILELDSFGDTGPLILAIEGVGSPPPSNYFTTLTINGTNFSSADAEYSTSGNTAGWQWAGFGFHTGDTYSVSYSP